MFPHSAGDIIILVSTSLSVLGIVSIAAGIFLLITRISGKSIQTLANQTARLAQKGIADEISGLVGNASALIQALNQLVQTSAGIGFFLVVFGFVMLIAAYYMVKP